MTDNNPHPFDALTPELVIDAVESTGRLSDLRILALNSYENRVYQVGIEDQEPIIVKFYRPERWSDEQILEEHQFAWQLADAEVPVIAPLLENGETLHHFAGFRFSMYPRRGGHAPEFDDLDSALVLGRLVGRIHAIGATRRFEHRPALTMAEFGQRSVELIGEQFIPAELRQSYVSLGEDILKLISEKLTVTAAQYIRVHGDCHAGNILWRNGQGHFVDLDDSRMAPAVQDIWMFLSGERSRQTAQLAELIDGYNEFFDFDPRQLQWIESLRTLRIMHYSAWLARRWQDPAFPHSFPWFNTPRYWSEHILELREQFALLSEPPLTLF